MIVTVHLDLLRASDDMVLATVATVCPGADIEHWSDDAIFFQSTSGSIVPSWIANFTASPAPLPLSALEAHVVARIGQLVDRSCSYEVWVFEPTLSRWTRVAPPGRPLRSQ